MIKYEHPSGFIILLFVILLLAAGPGCKKDESNPADSSDTENNGNTGGTSEQIRNENWLIGNWEGTTPGDAPAPFNNKKIRITFTAVRLAIDEHPQNTQTHRVYSYTGTITWDAGGSSEWNMLVSANDYPAGTGGGSLLWECTTFKPSTQFTEHISLNAYDTTSSVVRHSFHLDWGPMISAASKNYSYLDFYGDIELDSGSGEEIEFLPDNMLRLTRK